MDISASFFLISAYSLGSIPFGLLVTHLAKLPDLRQVGSGNIGATNVLRIAGPVTSGLVLIFDTAKGLLPVIMAQYFYPQWALEAGVLAVVGHIFPLWIGLRGGKGVATSLGAMLGLAWPLACVGLVVWIGVAVCSRYASLASLSAALSVVAVSLAFFPHNLALAVSTMALLIVVRHIPNVRSLILKRETRIGIKADRNSESRVHKLHQAQD